MRNNEKKHSPLVALLMLAGVTSVAARVAGILVIAGVVICLIVPNCLAQSVASPNRGVVQFTTGFEHSTLLRGSQGQAYLVIDLNAAQAQQQVTRPGMAVALVIDRSGSMSGDKMPNAILAASSFIQNMADGDIVSLFQYDDVVEQLAPPTVIGSHSRPILLAALSRMHPRGSTNLHGGLMAGIASLQLAGTERPIRRVILISDGLANVGPSSPNQIGAEASRAAMHGISVTAIGVGLDYDESVLGALAVRSGGRFYHLQNPMQMSAIMESELSALAQTVARNVSIDLVPDRGVQFLSATGADVHRRGSQIHLRVGDMLGGTNRPVVVALRVPTQGPSDRPAVSVGLTYTAAASGESRHASSTVRYRLAESQTAVDSSVNPHYAVAVELHQAAEANQRAAQLLQQGQSDQAADALNAQAQRMEQRARRLPSSQRARMEREAHRLRRSSSATRSARRPTARRAQGLRLSDDALEGLGF